MKEQTTECIHTLRYCSFCSKDISGSYAVCKSCTSMKATDNIQCEQDCDRSHRAVNVWTDGDVPLLVWICVPLVFLQLYVWIILTPYFNLQPFTGMVSFFIVAIIVFNGLCSLVSTKPEKIAK